MIKVEYEQMISIKIQKLFMLCIGLLAAVVVFLPAPKANADITICDDGFVQYTPGVNQLCPGGEIGDLVEPGDTCPNGYDRAGQAVPAGETGDWCANGATGGTVVQAPYYQQADCQEATPVSSENCGIVAYLVIFINILSGLAGIVITISLVYAGIQYSMAGSDPQKVSAAKARIRNTIIALVFLLFGYSILNFLIPGNLL